MTSHRLSLRDIGEAPLLLVLRFAIDLEAKKCKGAQRLFAFDDNSEDEEDDSEDEEEELGAGEDGGDFDEIDWERVHSWPRELLEIFGKNVEEVEEEEEGGAATPPGWSAVNEPFSMFLGIAGMQVKPEKFKSLFPETAAQIMHEKKMRQVVLSPARALGHFALVCKAFHHLVSEPALEEPLYSGIVRALGRLFVWECSYDGLSPDQGDSFLKGLFLAENKQHLEDTGCPSRIRVSNQDPSLGYFFGQNQHDLVMMQGDYFDHKTAREDHQYDDHFISDGQRAHWLRGLRTHDLKKSLQEKGGQGEDDAQFDWPDSPYRAEAQFLDPRMLHWIQDLEGIPVRAKQRFLQVARWADGNVSRLRSAISLRPTGELFKPHIPKPFNQCMKWCQDSIAAWEEAGGGRDVVSSWEEPDMYRVIDSIVSHAVKDFKDGCSHNISHDVLFEVGHYGECGWDNWSPCSGSSEYFVPFMVCKVPSDEWP